MESRSKNINSLWGYLLIEELVRNDITCFCISPGSRSTPITIAAAENNHAEKIICYDERASAFYAIGYARSSGKPAVIISTSGTAAANFYPAICEAKMSHIPLIILTADRPPELRDTGANQTMDQVKMFHNFLNWQFDLPCPDEKIPARFVLSTVDQTVHHANGKPAGAVHLNCMFREPLEPTNQTVSETYQKTIESWEQSGQPLTTYIPTIRSITTEEIEDISSALNQSTNGILVVGQLQYESERQAIAKIARQLQWPVFADIASGLRNDHYDIMTIDYFDQLLLSKKTIKKLKPDVICHFGRPLTSKRYLKTIEKFAPLPYFHIQPGDDRMDPEHVVSKRLCADIEIVCHQLMSHMTSRKGRLTVKYLIETDKKIEDTINSFCSVENELSEIVLPRLISRVLPQEQGLFLASSMPIRDFDMYSGSKIQTCHISSNRGISGIDGTVATAVGFAKGLGKRVTVVIGDLAMLHDLNSLSLVHASNIPLTIVIINNEGGGIFSFLPVSAVEHVFEKFFATPHKYKFEHAARMFGLSYDSPSTIDAFLRSYHESVHSKKSALIEISTDRKENYQLHQEIQLKIKTALEE